MVLKRFAAAAAAAAAVRGTYRPLAPISPGAFPPRPVPTSPQHPDYFFNSACWFCKYQFETFFWLHNSWTTKHKDLKNVQLQYSSTLPLGDHCILQVCNFLLTTSLRWKWGKGARRLTLPVIPLFWGGMPYPAAIGSFHPPLPPPLHPHPARRVSGLCVEGGLRQPLLWQLFTCSSDLFVLPPATPPPHHCPPRPLRLALTQLGTLRGSFRSYSV